METKSIIRQKLVVFTGAGISKESGIPTFRDADGLWKKYDAKELASVAGFEEKPQAVLDFYNARRKNLLEVEPNHAHIVLAELEQMHDVTIITQNVDNLHERAGSSRVIHLHGELTKVTSSRNRLDPDNIQEYPLEKPILLGDKAADGSQLRPYIVWFGEYLGPEIQEAIHLIEYADIFVVIGTSLVVYPAAGLVDYVHPEIPKFIVDPGVMDGKLPHGFMHIRAGAVDGIDILVEELKKL
ncbi:MAG: NAD-dependent protein deacylase [Prevotella sp.]|nr:NAD-dependent protein deacylase [Prevotella sp.]